MIGFKKIFDFLYQEQYSRGFVCICTSANDAFYVPHFDQSMANFAFGTIVGYNFVKYDALARAQKTNAKRVKIIAVLSLFSSIGVGYYFFNCS
jgi:hypothetical protein